jgi:hypothetical protein
MTNKTYDARIRFSNGASQHVFIQAAGYFFAKAMLEAQYGKGSICSLTEASSQRR